MNKKLLIAVVVLGLVLVAGVIGGFWMTNRARPTNVEALKTEQVEIEVTPTPAPAVRLEIFEGEVTVNNVAAVDGMIVNEGDQVATGMNGRAQLVYPSGTQTRLDNNAKITLKKFVANPQQISVFLEVGRIWNRVTKLFGGETYQTESSTVVATVRGTSYGMGILPDGTNRITATSGKVENKCNNESQAQDVTKNIKTEMNCKKGQKPKTFTLKESDIKNDNWLNFNSEEDKKQEQKFGPEKFDDTSSVLGVSTEQTQTIAPSAFPEVLTSCIGPDGKEFAATKKDCEDLIAFWKANTPKNPNPYGFGNNGGGGNSGSGSQLVESTPTPTPTPFAADVTVAGVAAGYNGVKVSVTGTGLSQDMRFRLIVGQNQVAEQINKSWFARVFEKLVPSAFAETEEIYDDDDSLDEHHNTEFEQEIDVEFLDKRITMVFPSLPCKNYDLQLYHKSFPNVVVSELKNKYLCTSQAYKIDNVQAFACQANVVDCIRFKVFTTNFIETDEVMLDLAPYVSPRPQTNFVKATTKVFNGNHFNVTFEGASYPPCGMDHEIKVVRPGKGNAPEVYAYWTNRVNDAMRKDCVEPTPKQSVTGVQITGEGNYVFSDQIIYYLSLKIDGLQGSVAKVFLDGSQGGIYEAAGSFDGSLYASFSTADSNLPPCSDSYKVRVDVDGVVHEWGGQISDQDRPNTCSIR